MINKNNYYSEINSVLSKLPDTLKKSHALVDKVTQGGKSWETYNNNETIKRVIDLYFTKLNDWVAAQKPVAAKAKPTREPKQKLSPGTKAFLKAEKKVVKKIKAEKIPSTYKGYEKYLMKKYKVKTHSELIEKMTDEEDVRLDELAVSKKKTVLPGTPVERISEELRFIKRYVNMNGKKKTHDQILSLINGLQKAIVEKRIRKTSPYAKEIEHIQEQLILAHNALPYNGSAEIHIEGKIFDRLKEIANSETQMKSIAFLKRYIGLHGKQNVKQKAEKLLKDVQTAIAKGKLSETEKYYPKVEQMISSLENYLNAKQAELVIEEAELNGICECFRVEGLGSFLPNLVIGGIAEIAKRAIASNKKEPVFYDKKKEALNGVMSIDQVKNLEYKPLPLSTRWKELIGEACAPTHIFVYGEGGSGKSSCVLQLSEHLSEMGFKVLFIAGEQFGTPAFTHLLNAAGIKGNANFIIAKDLKAANPADFDFIVLDSKDSLGISVEDFREMKRNYPKQSFIILSQGKKDGDFRGNESWRNEVDTLIQCEKFIARTNDKNRWGAHSEMAIKK